MKFRVISGFNSRRTWLKRMWSVPSLSGRSLLFSSGAWHKAVVYAMLRGDGVMHKDAARLAVHSTPDFRI